MDKYKISSNTVKSVDEDRLALVLSESKDLLGDTNESIKQNRNKAYNLFRIYLVVLFALIGYIFSSGEIECFKLISSIFWTMASIFCLITLFPILFPSMVAMNGTEPSKLLRDDIVGRDSKIMTTYIIQGNQRGIDVNIETNKKIVDKLKLTLKTTIAFFLIYLLGLIAASLFQWL